MATVETNGQISGAFTERSHGQHPIQHTTCLCRIPFRPSVFRVFLLRRFWCQFPWSSAICRCGQPHDFRGHHREFAPSGGFWVVEGVRWRVVRHGSAGKQEQGCLSTSVSKTLTFRGVPLVLQMRVAARRAWFRRWCAVLRRFSVRVLRVLSPLTLSGMILTGPSCS